MSFELEATIRDLYQIEFNLLVVKNKSIELPFVTWNKKNLFPFGYYRLMNYFRTQNSSRSKLVTITVKQLNVYYVTVTIPSKPD